jgi:putative modified peptide
MTNGELRLRIDITSAQVDELVEKLAYDDEFREALAANPAESLAPFGIEIPAELLDSEGVVLPPKEEVQEAIEAGHRGEFMRIQAGAEGIFTIFRALFAWPGLIRR